MLDTIFASVLNMSFTASFVILAVVIARLFLQKLPKVFSYALWSVVLFRLVCPFSFESVLSALPTGKTPISQELLYSQAPQINTGIPIINSVINPLLPIPAEGVSVNPLQIWLFIGEIIWCLGIITLLIYSVISLLLLKKKLKNATLQSENIYITSSLESPIVIGLIRPKIYLPSSLSNDEAEYILLHEQTHIKNHDHIVKLISFLVLSVHWFNPLVWLAFFLCSKDMEMTCDEAVIEKLGSDVKKDYSTSLLTLATGRKFVVGTPLAFGEGDTKGRIKNVLNYKKPAFWVLFVAVIAVLALVFSLISNPKEEAIVETREEAGVETLWKNRTQYVGDNSAVGNIINELSFPEDISYDSFELHTDERPYEVTVKFNTDTETRNSYIAAFSEEILYKNAVIMFSLIENVEQINFLLNDGHGSYYTTFGSESGEVFLGENYFEKTETLEGFKEVLQEISQSIIKLDDAYSIQNFPSGDIKLTIQNTEEIPEFGDKNEGTAYYEKATNQLHFWFTTAYGHPSGDEVKGPLRPLAGAKVNFDWDIENEKILSSEFTPGASKENVYLDISDRQLEKIAFTMIGYMGINQKSTNDVLDKNTEVYEEEFIALPSVDSVKESLKSAYYGSNGWVINLPINSDYLFAEFGPYILRYDVKSNVIDGAADLGIIQTEEGSMFSATFAPRGRYAIVSELDKNFAKTNLHLIDFEKNEIKFLAQNSESFDLTYLPLEIQANFRIGVLSWDTQSNKSDYTLSAKMEEDGMHYYASSASTVETKVDILSNLLIDNERPYYFIDRKTIVSLIPIDKSKAVDLGYYKFVVYDLEEGEIKQECLINQ